MKHLFLINPAAGKHDGTFDCAKVVHDLCEAKNLDYEIRVSKQPGDLTRYAREAAETGIELRIYACGGDGTLNEVLQGAACHDNVAITAYPIGSGNDSVKIFSDPKQFLDLEALIDGEETRLDLIRCNDDCYSINICSMGLDARIAADMAKYKKIPMVRGIGAYLASTAVNVFKGITAPFTVEVNGETIEGDQTMICICSGRFYGSGFNPVPDAVPDDGLLDVLLVAPVRLWEVPKLIGPYKAGKYQELPQWIRRIRTTELRIRTPEEAVVNVDGEAIWTKDMTFQVLPRAIRFFHPRGLTY